MRRLACVAALACLSAAASAAPAPIAGRWLTAEGKAIVDIGSCGGAGAGLCGRITDILKPKPGPAVDLKNPDPALRSRPIRGMAFLTGFHPAGDRWKGRIYDPETGRTYRSELARTGGTLKVKGCWGPFCRTQDWTVR